MWLLALTSLKWQMARNNTNKCSRKQLMLNGFETVERFTHPIPNNLTQPSISFEVTLESNSLTNNNRRQGLYGNCQISWKKRMETKTFSTVTYDNYTFSETVYNLVVLFFFFFFRKELSSVELIDSLWGKKSCFILYREKNILPCIPSLIVT